MNTNRSWKPEPSPPEKQETTVSQPPATHLEHLQQNKPEQWVMLAVYDRLGTEHMLEITVSELRRIYRGIQRIIGNEDKG